MISFEPTLGNILVFECELKNTYVGKLEIVQKKKRDIWEGDIVVIRKEDETDILKNGMRVGFNREDTSEIEIDGIDYFVLPINKIWYVRS